MSIAEEVTLTLENPESADAQALMQRADAEAHARYPSSSVHGIATRDIAAFIIARVAGKAVACGAVRPLEPGIGEVKRMFVEPAFRCRGLARQILRKIEAVAQGLGFTALRLETGTTHPEAILLYESAGFLRISRFGEYTDDPFSVCFEKPLK